MLCFVVQNYLNFYPHLLKSLRYLFYKNLKTLNYYFNFLNNYIKFFFIKNFFFYTFTFLYYNNFIKRFLKKFKKIITNNVYKNVNNITKSLLFIYIKKLILFLKKFSNLNILKLNYSNNQVTLVNFSLNKKNFNKIIIFFFFLLISYYYIIKKNFNIYYNYFYQPNFFFFYTFPNLYYYKLYHY